MLIGQPVFLNQQPPGSVKDPISKKKTKNMESTKGEIQCDVWPEHESVHTCSKQIVYNNSWDPVGNSDSGCSHRECSFELMSSPQNGDSQIIVLRLLFHSNSHLSLPFQG